MKSIYPQLRLTDPNFNYISSAKTDIRETFRKFSESNQESKKANVAPTLNPGGFVLSTEWFDME